MFGVGRCGGIERTSLLADIGGETGAAIHGASIAGPGRRPKRLDTAKRLSDRLLCCEARQPIGDVEPRSLEVHEDVTLWPKSGIIVECPGRDADHAPVYRR
jgi:hypothetical protein